VLTEWFWTVLDTLQNNTCLQGLVAGAGTWIFEDGVSIGCAMLAASRDMHWQVVLTALTFGIASGDFALYLTGRFASKQVFKRNWISRRRLLWAEQYFSGHMVKAIFMARFLPGTRTVTFVAAGMLGAPFWRFLLLATLASFLQTAIYLAVAMTAGSAMLPYLQNTWLRVGVVIAVLAGVVMLNIVIARRHRLKEEAAVPDVEALIEHETPTTFFEFWPIWVFYFPVLFYIVYLAIRFRGLRVTMASNPCMYASGLVRESKQQIYALFSPEVAARWLGRVAVSPPIAQHQTAEERLVLAREALAVHGVGFPLVAKPDIGQRGVGVKRMGGEADLLAYFRQFPKTQAVIMQTLITRPNEAGVLYVRKPGEAHGQVVSLGLKAFPNVTGDGIHTLRQLILADNRCRKLARVYFAKQKGILDDVLPAGEVRQLNFAGNHAQGTIFINGNHAITPGMSEVFDGIARSLGEFYYGRFDIRYDSLEQLQRGEAFTIIEVNGAGAEPIHIWDGKMSLRGAYAAVLWQHRHLYEVGALNVKRGFPTLSPWQVLRDYGYVCRLVRLYPPAD
jgi:membrane protein DedA with SNARE-associated domain